MENNTPKNTVNAVQTSLTILEALGELDGAGVTELAEHIGATKATVYNHLSTLKGSRYVVKEDDDTYRLGLRFLDIAHHARNRVRIFDLVRQEVDALAEETGEMVLFTVEEHGVGICLYRAYGEQAIRTPLYVGHQSGLHHTAVGKAILAHLPEERRREILDQQALDEVTSNTITDREELLEELDGIRETGIATSSEETIQGLIGVGAPIIDQNRAVVGAISIIGPRSRMKGDRLQEELPDQIQRSVNIIEINMTSI
ncbi:IclR family transcriptional regulator [Haladaptatus sp. CMAA 1911]|uniref:IclR family transcriptional regulator n=1 Tax=unclassified Haladaptatus TaxID=2622732 RepID=UPI003754C07E